MDGYFTYLIERQPSIEEKAGDWGQYGVELRIDCLKAANRGRYGVEAKSYATYLPKTIFLPNETFSSLKS